MTDYTDEEIERIAVRVEKLIRQRIAEQMERTRAEFLASQPKPRIKPLMEEIGELFDRIEAKIDKLLEKAGE